MAHQAQKDFFLNLKAKHPHYFDNVFALDCGSLDVNGSLREIFDNSRYVGIDIHGGKNVDRVISVVEFAREIPNTKAYDVVVSGEMLEHSETWQQDLRAMYSMVRKGGLMAITAAGEGRPEHGTKRTGAEWGTAPDYYQNITPEMIAFALPQEWFSEYEIIINDEAKDIYFYGIKKNDK
jgi:SAM-dependent methyltransferase